MSASAPDIANMIRAHQRYEVMQTTPLIIRHTKYPLVLRIPETYPHDLVATVGFDKRVSLDALFHVMHRIEAARRIILGLQFVPVDSRTAHYSRSLANQEELVDILECIDHA